MSQPDQHYAVTQDLSVTMTAPNTSKAISPSIWEESSLVERSWFSSVAQTALRTRVQRDILLQPPVTRSVASARDQSAQLESPETGPPAQPQSSMSGLVSQPFLSQWP